MKAKVKTTKVKQTARNLRIWIEGRMLTEAGFTWHTPYNRKMEVGKITLTIASDVSPTRGLQVAGRMRGDKEIPIIDISIANMEGFTADQELTVTYTDGKIVIK